MYPSKNLELKVFKVVRSTVCPTPLQTETWFYRLTEIKRLLVPCQQMEQAETGMKYFYLPLSSDSPQYADRDSWDWRKCPGTDCTVASRKWSYIWKIYLCSLFSSLGSTSATYWNVNKRCIEYPLRLFVYGLSFYSSCSDSSACSLRSAALQAV